MNKEHLDQIIKHYIREFEKINGMGEEYYKWQICKEFPVLMKEALDAPTEDFANALYKAKKCTENIIDGYTQPFSGLVDLARKESEAENIRGILKRLYADDGGDLKVQMEIIENFFNEYDEVLERHYQDSFLYKQNSHSVSALLFLNDPEHHFMYKATQSKAFADCVEFYDDWGSGDNIRLDTYYRMCNELVKYIKECPELLELDAKRKSFDTYNREFHEDAEKHILAFDIIYCCTVYDLFDGITYKKRNYKEKQQYVEEKRKAEVLKAQFEKANSEMMLLQEALSCFMDLIRVGDTVKHIKRGAGVVKAIDVDYVSIDFNGEVVPIGLAIGVGNGILSVEKDGFADKVNEYRDVLKRYDSVPRALDYAARALEGYEEYLE
ncbi:MAG: hypothetical protein IJM91_07475 [Lachnospiraceae bacterium]|nr:hypothetical protein [Lachnospiraceae bacterium]